MRLERKTDAQIEREIQELNESARRARAAARELHVELDRRLLLERHAQAYAEGGNDLRLLEGMDPVTVQDVVERSQKWATHRTEPGLPAPAPAPERRGWLRGR